ncbi:MAG: IS256 family transposase [Ardenticatenia bacterium]|nr:IS256 family transposase [Ardenticatenia bacterium]
MAHQTHYTLPDPLLEVLLTEEQDGLRLLMERLLNLLMLAERQAYLRAEPYQRTPERRDQANGFKPKTLKTRLGPLDLRVPQVRKGSFYPSVLTKGLRSERAAWNVLAEMYVHGVSTRKVATLVEEVLGFEVSSATVSRAAQDLDETLQAWRERPLGEQPCRYLYLDAHYEHVRVDGQIRDVVVLVAVGVCADGHRRVLGVDVALSEQEVHWRQFLQRLVKRGLRGVQLIISDDHAGLRAARQAVFGGIPWQRCQFHLQQNAQAYVPRKEMQAEVAARIRQIFNTPNRAQAEQQLKELVAEMEKRAPRLARWLEENLPEGFTVFGFPESHRRKLRTNNITERLTREMRRRARVVSIFPNEAACLRLMSAVLMEQDEAWATGRLYLRFEGDTERTT